MIRVVSGQRVRRSADVPSVMAELLSVLRGTNLSRSCFLNPEGLGTGVLLGAQGSAWTSGAVVEDLFGKKSGARPEGGVDEEN